MWAVFQVACSHFAFTRSDNVFFFFFLYYFFRGELRADGKDSQDDDLSHMDWTHNTTLIYNGSLLASEADTNAAHFHGVTDMVFAEGVKCRSSHT